MNRGFATELRRVVIFTIVAVLLGLIFDQLVWTLVIGGTLYMVWILWQIRQLDIWLKDSNASEPPDASGIWGEIFDSMVRLQKSQKTEKTQLESIISRGQDITESLKDGMILLNADGEIEWTNLAARQLLGIREEDHGFPVINFLRHPEFISYFETGDYREYLELSAPYSESIYLQYQITPFGKSENLLMVRNITRVHNLELVRKDFVANVSHELRTPLTVLHGYLETFSGSSALPKPWEKAVAQMQQQTARMENLVNDLMVLSKLETATTREPQSKIMLISLLQRIRADALAINSNDHQIVINCEDSLTLLGSEKELYSALSNLVVNGVKYSVAGGDILINVSLNNEGIQVSVEDQGPGIDLIHLPRLTERFYRVDSSRHSETGGTGLGLAIVKHVLSRHNAELDIESQIGVGSKFICRFPSSRVVN